MEDSTAFFNRRGVVEAYLRSEDVHHDVGRRFAREQLSPALDIGCGDGKLARVLEGTGIWWIGIDLTPAMLARAPTPKLRGDAAWLPFRSGTFGAAAAMYMLYRLTERERQHVKALYAAEISMVDKWFGRLLEQVDHLGYRDDTLVVHLSDHGHYFGDHGLQGKPFRELLWLYEGISRTALTVRLPNRLLAGSRVTSPVQPVDVTATILDVAGAELPGAQGHSLLPVATGGPAAREVTFTSRYPLLAGEVTPTTITTAEWSYQYWPGSPEKERLHFLPQDPGQAVDLRSEKPEIAHGLRATYLGWLHQQDPDIASWLESVERDAAYRPDSAKLFRGTL